MPDICGASFILSCVKTRNVHSKRLLGGEVASERKFLGIVNGLEVFPMVIFTPNHVIKQFGTTKLNWNPVPNPPKILDLRKKVAEKKVAEIDL